MGMMKKVTRKIDGETYHLHGTSSARKKSIVLKEAKRVKKIGFPVRVIKCKGGYRLFSRYTRYKYSGKWRKR